MKIVSLLGLMIIAAFSVSCTTGNAPGLRRNRPRFDPIEFFTGRTSSSGKVESPIAATRGVKTQTRGQRRGDTLVLEQNLEFSDGKRQHRSWRIRRQDEHHFIATANDMVGSATGVTEGNSFHWTFTLALSPGHSLENVEMTQWMYLQPDGRSILNYTTIRKLGLVVGKVTETFRKSD